MATRSNIATAPVENCAECGFGADRWNDAQAVGAFLIAGALCRGVLGEVRPEVANTRPAPDCWSLLEYVEHMRTVLRMGRFAAEAALAEPGIDLRTGGGERTIDTATRRFDDVESTVAAMEAEGAELFTVLNGLEPQQWSTSALLDRGMADQRCLALHALHELLHHLHDLGRVQARLGGGVDRQVGSVAQLNRGGGGVPKAAVDEVDVAMDGVVGDRQNDRVNHGRPFQAVCLYSTEAITGLNGEGHTIHPGAAGENVTVAGIEWARLRPGTIVALGEEVTVEISSYAIPCAKNAQWFADRDFRRIHHDVHPGWSRLYATVLRPGRLRTGDAVIVEP